MINLENKFIHPFCNGKLWITNIWRLHEHNAKKEDWRIEEECLNDPIDQIIMHLNGLEIDKYGIIKHDRS